jgi:hypothetical protein
MSFKIFDTSYKKNVIKSDCGDCIENFKTSLIDSLDYPEQFAMGTINNYPCIVYNKTNDEVIKLFFRQYKTNSWTEPIILDTDSINGFFNMAIINLPDNTIVYFII